MGQLVISCLVLRIETKYRSTGDKLLQLSLLQSDNLKQVINQAVEEINLVRNMSVSSLELNIGSLSLDQFEKEFNQRLTQAFAEYLLQQSESVRSPRQGQPSEERALYSLAVNCLQPTGLARLDKHHLPPLLRQLLASVDPPAVSAAFYRRATPGSLAVATLLYLLNSARGLQFLANNYPNVPQLNIWVEAIADGEIAPELVVQLMLYPQSTQQHEVARRWLLPLWQRKAVRDAVSQHTGKATAVEIDTYLRSLLQHAVQQHSQDTLVQKQHAVQQHSQDTLVQKQHSVQQHSQHTLLPQRPTYPVSNAGIVILWTLLPQLFSLLALCDEGEFISGSARWQAVATLDWLVWREQPPAEGRLKVGQLLCGIPLDTALPEFVPLTPQQRQRIDAWLTAVSQQLPVWQKLSLTDIRQLFLQRPGEIVTDTEPPQLAVHPEAFDYLLGDWPWPLTMVALPWLEQPLTLNWPLPHLTG